MEAKAKVEDDDSDSSVYEEYEDASESKDFTESIQTPTTSKEGNHSVKNKKGLKGKLKLLYRHISDDTDKSEPNDRLSAEVKMPGLINSLGNKLKLKRTNRNSASDKKVDMENPVCESSDSECDPSVDPGDTLVYQDLVPTDEGGHKYDQLKVSDNQTSPLINTTDMTAGNVSSVNEFKVSEPSQVDAPPVPSRGSRHGILNKLPVNIRKKFEQQQQPRPATLPSICVTLEPPRIKESSEDLFPSDNEIRYKSILESDALYQIYDEEKISRAWDKEAIYSDFDDSDEEYYVDEEESIYEDVTASNSEHKPEPEESKAIDNVRISETTKVPAKKNTVLKTLWSETEEVKNSGVLQQMSAHEIKLQESLFEIITSEATFLKSLNVLIDVFMESEEFNPKKGTSVLTKRDHQVIFSNIGAIQKASEKFLSDLEALWKKSAILYEVCEIIHEHATSQNFECYVHYCRNQEFQERALADLRKRTDFTEALKSLEGHPDCQRLSLSSFLLLPMQRITRLPLLLDAVCNRMDLAAGKEWSDIAFGAYKAISKIVKRCNESARKIQQTEQMVQIAKNIYFSTTKEITKVPLISSSRHLIKDGDLVRIVSNQSSRLSMRESLSKTKPTKQPLHVFLFNDLIVLTKKKGNEKYSVVDYGQRNLLHTEILDDPEQLNKFFPSGTPAGSKFLFLLVILQNHEKKQVESVFSCISLSDRERWVSAITPGKASDDQKIYEEWDCPQVQCIRKFSAREADELTLEEADIVNVFKKLEDGMYEGERIRDGARGWFPKDFTREIENAHVRARNLRMQYRLKTAAAEGDSSC